MGYTHYWDRQPVVSQLAFVAFSVDVSSLIKASGVEIGNGHGEKGSRPETTHDLVSFNGIAEEGHETFWFPLADEKNPEYRKGKSLVFNFCKTAHKPYDVVVTAALIAAKQHFGAAIKVASDGDDSDWEDGRQLAQRVLGYGAQYHLGKNGLARRRRAA